jgi:hypothetical protein
MEKMRILSIFILTIPLFVNAAPGDTVPTEKYLSELKGSAKRMCVYWSLLRTCFSVNEETCVSRVESRLDGCIRDQRIKLMGQATMSKPASQAVEREVKACVNREYYFLAKDSFVKNPGCTAMIPNASPAAQAKAQQSQARPEHRTAAYEDPIDEQRPLVDRYMLRIAAETRDSAKFKKALKTRQLCPGYQGKDYSGCFKQGLRTTTITSSTALTLWSVLGVAAALLDREAGNKKIALIGIVDNPLLVMEATDLSNFHLTRLQPKSDADQLALERLRADDEKLLRMAVTRLGQSLDTHLAKKAGPARAPASSNLEFNARIEFQRKRNWSYGN